MSRNLWTTSIRGATTLQGAGMPLSPVAADQHGLVTRYQARAEGISDGAYSRAVRAGRLTALAPGVVIDTTAWQVLDRRGQHLVRAHAEILALGDPWHLARRTAAVLHGLPLLGQAPAQVQLMRPREAPSVRARSRHRRISALLESERTALDGVPVTTLARTVFDIARLESFRSGLVAADAALRTGLSREELERLVLAHRRTPGTQRAQEVIAFADGRAESPLESLGRVTCREQRLPVFEPQVNVYLDGEFIARVDGLWRDRLIVFEGDGALKFTDGKALPDLLTRQERLREAGLPVVRASWGDLTTRRARWAQGVRRELTDNPGRPRRRVELVSTMVRPTPLERSDHYRWPPPTPDLSTELATPAAA